MRELRRKEVEENKIRIKRMEEDKKQKIAKYHKYHDL